MNEFTQLADLASERLGGRVIYANDDFFAPKENLLKEAKPVFIGGRYTSRGKWMDGWETRRRRTPGYDWCLIRLGLPGTIRGVVVDTSFFTGNYPQRFSLEGCELDEGYPYKDEKNKLSSSKTNWIQLLPESSLQADSQNRFLIEHLGTFTHLRLKIFPDGGVARLRVHGEAVPDKKRLAHAEMDLAALENGGCVVTSSDQFYGAPRNLLMPYAAKNMGDGWETQRKRGPGHDWVILKLGVPGTIRRVEVNTAHFKGNFPDSCSLEACCAKNSTVNSSNVESLNWVEVLPQTKLKANHRHLFDKLEYVAHVTHVRFHIYPDGGLSRLRIFGRPEFANHPSTGVEEFNQLARTDALKALLDCCGAKQWAEQMASQRPFASVVELYGSAETIWARLGLADWLEAFRHHPPIGGKQAKARQSKAERLWSAKEQSAIKTATPKVLMALAAENKAYARKFGYVFLICAAGKSSGEILTALRQRIRNTAEIEWRIAAEEQRKITRLRLERLLGS